MADPAAAHAADAQRTRGGDCARLRALTLPAVPAAFSNPVNEIALGITVKGEIPAAAPRRAAEAWRDLRAAPSSSTTWRCVGAGS